MTVSKRVTIAALIAVVSLVLGAAAPSTALAAGARIVDDNYPSPSACKGAGYATIQAAVNNFSTGQSGTIKVCAGTYVETVSISNLGKIKLLGLPGAIIAAPGAFPLVAATNTTRLTVQGFTLDGSGYTSAGMLFFQNSSGVVTKNVFQNSSGGYGVAANITSGTVTLKVTNNDFMSIGVGVSAVSNSGALSAKVTGNDFTGAVIGVTIGTNPGGTAVATVTDNHLQGTAGNFGIQVYETNKARVSRNKIDGFGIGIFLTDLNLARVSNNKVRSAEYGIIILASSANANSNKVQGNTLEPTANSFIGIWVAAGSGLAADFNQVKGNTITDPGPYTGTIGIKLENLGTSLNKTVIKGNKLVNMDTPYTHTGDSGTAIGGNTCTPVALPCIS